ncbi:hypothetical protein [Mycobacterium intracellulare]|uniref:hypothetical protein n=1 Tax=Mycobacterium intracellulare TaxID=1767 RepID=UPI00109E3DED|nr:hypothetical protein [Mycobacterium intracellulare]
MAESEKTLVPVWTLTTRDVTVPPLTADVMTPDRLRELRTVLAAMADAPTATLEAHPLTTSIDRSKGLHLDAASPLATHLSRLIAQTPKPRQAAVVGAGSETLYRMVVPAKVASQVSSGLVKPMASKAVSGGVHSAMTGSFGIAAQATFVPVAAGEAAAVGAAGGSAATAGVAAAGAGAMTVAAPLVLMAVAVGMSAYADQKRQRAIDNITSLLEKLHDDNLQRERTALNGCRAAIDKATAILLDQGRIGASVGLSPAVYAIDTAVAEADSRLKKWQVAIAELGDESVEIAKLRTKFDGIDKDEGGLFRAHLDLAELAIALKKRVLVLQAVEHAQMDESNPFESFVQSLRADQHRVLELESGIADVLRRLSALKLTRPRGVREIMFTRSEVDTLLSTSYRLRELGNGLHEADQNSDVAIDIVRATDGSVMVLPATAIA